MKVVRDVITNLTGGAGGGTTTAGTTAAGATGGAAAQMMVCPQRRSTGFFPGGDGTIPNARPGLIPGTWIGPTLIFAGVLNPGIPTTLPPTNPVVVTTGTQIQIAPAANQTTTTTASSTTTGAGGTVVG